MSSDPSEKVGTGVPPAGDVFDMEAVMADLGRRAAGRKAAGRTDIDALAVDIAAQERLIATPELENLRDVVAQQLGLLRPSPGRSLLRRMVARIEWLVVRDDSASVVIARKEASDFNVAVMQYLAMQARQIAELRAAIAKLQTQPGGVDGRTDAGTTVVRPPNESPAHPGGAVG